MNIRTQITAEVRLLVAYLTSLAETVIPPPYELSRTINGSEYSAAEMLSVARALHNNVTAENVVIEYKQKKAEPLLHEEHEAEPRFNEYEYDDDPGDEPVTKRDTFVETALDPRKYPQKPAALPNPFGDDPDDTSTMFGSYPAQITDAAIDRAMIRDEREIQNIFNNRPVNT